MNLIHKIIRNTLFLLVVIMLLFVIVRKVSEPIFSDLITQPITDKISESALEDLFLPPTQEELSEYTQRLALEGTIKYSTDLVLRYEQSAGESNGGMTASYRETLLGFVNMNSSSYKAISNRPIYDEDISISSSVTDVSQGEEYALRRSEESIAKDKQRAEKNSQDTSSHSELAMGDLNDTSAVKITEDNETTEADAVSYEETAVSEDTAAGDNGVALYVNDVYFDRYATKEEALRLAALIKNAALIDLSTHQVIWDNYARSTD